MLGRERLEMKSVISCSSESQYYDYNEQVAKHVSKWASRLKLQMKANCLSLASYQNLKKPAIIAPLMRVQTLMRVQKYG